MYKLGKRPAKLDARTFQFINYAATIPPAPMQRDWSIGVKFTLGMNDKIGDCAIVAPANQVGGWTFNAKSKEILPTDKQILAAYSVVSGYNKYFPWTDRGCVMLDVLNYWRKTGVGGHKILAYVQVNKNSTMQIQQAANLFGGLYAGFQLPKSAQAQVGKLWDVDNTRNGAVGSWGGHAVYLPAYTPSLLACITWKQLQQMTWRFLLKYSDELYAIVTQDWIEKDKLSPVGFDVAALLADLAALDG